MCIYVTVVVKYWVRLFIWSVLTRPVVDLSEHWLRIFPSVRAFLDNDILCPIDDILQLFYFVRPRRDLTVTVDGRQGHFVASLFQLHVCLLKFCVPSLLFRNLLLILIDEEVNCQGWSAIIFPRIRLGCWRDFLVLSRSVQLWELLSPLSFLRLALDFLSL